MVNIPYMHVRKAILTGGGRATRLYPITTTINKHLLPLANKPMIVHAIEKVVAAGITEIFINTNPGDKSLAEAVGDGGHWGVTITLFEQTGGPQGIAHVVNEARHFIGDDPFLFYLSDNIFLGDLNPFIRTFESGNYDCFLAFASVKDPERFGVPVFDAAGVLIDVWEKPKTPPNHLAVTGMYLYGPKIFFETFPQIEKSPRGEYEISSIHAKLLKDGRRVGYQEVTGWWKDTGKPEDLLAANELLLGSIVPPVAIGAGAVVGQDVVLRAPVVIGEDCILERCTIGPNVSLGKGSRVTGAMIENSMILDGAVIEGAWQIHSSLLGRGVTLRAGHDHWLRERLILGDKSVIDTSAS